jgi:Ca-activated chloride channel homolog
MKVLTASALVLSLAVTGLAQFRSGVDLVTFSVVVADRKGPIENLTREDFTILEEGKPQTIQFFSKGDVSSTGITADRLALRLGLLFDVSASMGMDLDLSKTAAIKFMNTLDHAKDVTLVDFDTDVRLARYRPDDYARLIERIRSKKVDGWTALYDAIGAFINAMAMEDGQKVLVLYTDGGDTRSRMTMSQILDLLKWIDVTVYAVGFVQHQGSGRVEQRMKLEQIAHATGGQAFFPTSRDELGKMYDKIVQELNGRYTLGYVSNNAIAKGGFRKVDIKVTNPAFKNIKIRTRNGYFAAPTAGTGPR